MDKYVINIGRQLGSGGRAVGKILARELGISYFDREILTLAARESGFMPEVFENTDERKGFFRSILGGIIPALGASADYYDNQLSEEHLFRLQSDAIRCAASEQSCIFIGRCADYVLRDMPRCVNIFLAADPEDRIHRIMEARSVDRAAAERIMQQGDTERARFYDFYTGGQWGAARTYHLCINTSVLGIERTAELICDYAMRRLEGADMDNR